jgi:hypothetical protein
MYRFSQWFIFLLFLHGCISFRVSFAVPYSCLHAKVKIVKKQCDQFFSEYYCIVLYCIVLYCIHLSIVFLRMIPIHLSTIRGMNNGAISAHPTTRQETISRLEYMIAVISGIKERRISRKHPCGLAGISCYCRSVP